MIALIDKNKKVIVNHHENMPIYNIDLLKPHLYLAKLGGFTGVKNIIIIIIFFFYALLRARRNEKEMKVKPATSFKLLTIFIYKKKNETRFKTKECK